MDKFVICVDMDGTLLDNKSSIHPKDVAILRKGDNLLLIPCTGRPLHSVRDVFSEHGLFLEQRISYPLVLQNGSLVFEAGEVLYRYHPFEKGVQKSVITAMLNQDQITFLIFSKDRIYQLWSNQQAKKLIERFQLQTQPFSEDQPQEQYSKFMAICDNPDRLNAFAESVQLEGLVQTFSLPTVLELNPKGVNKGKAVEELLDKLNLSKVSLFVAGDGGNDLPLFELTENSFAPATSPPEIQERARYVINTKKKGLLEPILDLAQQQV